MSDKEIATMTYNQFASARGLVTDYDVQGHIHGGLMAAHMPNSYHRRFQRKLLELQASRAIGVAEYMAAIDAGEVSAPEDIPRRQRLEIAAAGDPDMPSTQAAKSVLAKMDEKKLSTTQIPC